MKVIGTGVGRTGTMSLRVALQQLGFGPCYHMEVVTQDMPLRVPHWNAALEGNPDWAATFDGFPSAVDWPVATFYKEMYEAFPDAKFVLTHRSPESWVESFGETIYTSLAGAEHAPDAVQDWLAMATGVISRAGFPLGMSPEELAEAFNAHNEAVKSAIPAESLLVFQVKEGWGPLCEFLGVPVPEGDFPRTNNREEFWELVNAAGQ